ncbi:MAG: hypothetical protein ACRENC_01375 [Gemmatimonadaceae bacterium]
MTMPITAIRHSIAAAALLFIASGPPVYPGATRDLPPVASTTVGADATLFYKTSDSFEKVDSFYRAHGMEDTGSRRISPTAKRALYSFKDTEGEVLISWPRVGTLDETTIMIYAQ